MTAANTSTINIVPVQGIFGPEPTFTLVSLVGPAGSYFYPNINPQQSGLVITNSTIDSSPIGSISPSTGAFTSGTVLASPASAYDLVNKQYVDYFAAGLSWKTPAIAATTVNLASLSGLLTIDTITLAAGDIVLVKDQSTASQNGIYLASSGAWSRSPGGDVWSEYVGAIIFVVEGSQAGSAWYCTAQPGGTLGTTAINWSNFSVSATYTAGTGLTLTGTQFSITPVGTAGIYGSASSVPVITTNASGQVSAVTNTAIAIANTAVSGLGTMSTQNANAVAITGGTIESTTVGATTATTVRGTTITATSQFTGAGTGLTGTATSLSIGGNAATATSATTATNLASGAAGSVPYQSAAGTTAMLAAGSNGQVLTLAAGIPSWATNGVGTVTSIAQSFTGGLISVSGSPITTSGTLALTVAGTSGGIPYFSNGTTWASSAALAAGAIVLGGGAGVTPATTTTGTGVVTALGVSTGSAGAFVINGGALGTPSSGTVTNLTGTASININGTVGATAASTAAVTTLNVTSTIALSGSTGTAGQVITSNGASAPTWGSGSGTTIVDDTTTNATRYPLFTSATTGTITTANTSSTKMSFNPSTGILTTTQHTAGQFNVTGSSSGSAAIVTPAAAGTPTLTLPTNTGTLIADFSTPAYRNRIINGGQGIDQVNAGASQTYTAAAAVAYNVDMFYGSCTGANVTGQRVAGTTAEYAYQYTGAASVTGILHGTRIESHNVWDLTSQTATLSATLSNSLLTTVTWTAYYANATDNFSAKTQIATGTFTVTSTPTIYSAQIAMGANAKNGVSIQFTVGAQTSGTWLIENIQLEKGASATAFDFRDYESELARCQRLYAKTFSASVKPVQNVGNGDGALAGVTIAAVVGPTATWKFPVEMRTVPTITTFNPGAANANWRNFTGASDEPIGTAAASTGAVRITPGGGGVTGYCGIHITADARL